MRWKLLKAFLEQLMSHCAGEGSGGEGKSEELEGREKEVVYILMKCGDSYNGY